LEKVMRDLMIRAADSYRKDARFHALAQAHVSRAMTEHGPLDPEAALRDVYDIALRATALLLQSIYEDDAELRALREENARLKELAFVGLASRPQSFFIPAGHVGNDSA